MRFTRFGPVVAIDWVGAALCESGQADDVEGEISLAEVRKPVGNHGGEDLAVLVPAWGVLLTLIPDGAGDQERCDGSEHAFVEDGIGMTGQFS